jgi:hypothetical protein
MNETDRVDHEADDEEADEEMDAADRRNGEPGTLHQHSPRRAVPTGASAHEEIDHLERHPHGGEMPSDVEVQAERQEEGMEAEEEHP